MQKGCVELLVSTVLLECKDLLVQLVNKVNVVRKETMVFNVWLEIKAIVVNDVNVGEKGIQGENSDVYWLIINRFNWRLDMVKKYALSSTMYQRTGRVS